MATPAWKQAILDARREKAEKAQQVERAPEQEALLKYSNLPAWKRDLLIKKEQDKEKQQAQEAAAAAPQRRGSFSAIPNIRRAAESVAAAGPATNGSNESSAAAPAGSLKARMKAFLRQASQEEVKPATQPVRRNTTAASVLNKWKPGRAKESDNQPELARSSTISSHRKPAVRCLRGG
jgi:hypothetical protein